MKNTTVQSQLMERVTELLGAEEKLNRKLSPSSIKTISPPSPFPPFILLDVSLDVR